MDQNKDSQPKQALPSGWALIEKAQELRWTLQLAVAVLFADMMLVWHTGHGIAQWSTSIDKLLADSGVLVTGMLAFGVLMSIVMPLAGTLSRWAIWQLTFAIPWPSGMRSLRDYRRKPGMVCASELLDHALAKGDKLLLDMHSAYEQRKSANESANLVTGQAIFSVLVLGALNYFAQALGIHGTTLTQTLGELLGQSAEIVSAAGFWLAILILKGTWFSDRDLDWIYYPPLYDEIEKENRRKREGR